MLLSRVQLGIGDTHWASYNISESTSKHGRVGLGIEASIFTLLEGIKLTKAKGHSNLPIERDSTIILSRVNKKERSFYITLDLDSLANYMVNI